MAEEEQEAEEVASRMVLATPNLNEGQTGQLRDLLKEYDDVVCQKIGQVEGVDHKIETGEHACSS